MLDDVQALGNRNRIVAFKICLFYKGNKNRMTLLFNLKVKGNKIRISKKRKYV